MRSLRLHSLLLALVLGFGSFQASAIDKTVDSILDIVIQELSPELAPAKPFIVCLIEKNSDVEACTKSFGGGYLDQAKGEAKDEAKKALPFDPNSQEVKLVLAIVNAAKDGKWDVVIGKGGPYVARAIVCAVFVPPGVKSFGCPVIGYVIEHKANLVGQVLAKLKSNDVIGLVKLLVAEFDPSIACELIPDSALPAGTSVLKDIGCSVIGEIFAGAKKIADEVAGAVVKGADAVENLLFGDDSHMPYEKYYGLYWQPWYHYGTSLCLGKNCEGLGNLNASIGGPCVSYFDSHNQYKSTAEKTCGDMRNKFDKEVKSFKTAMEAASDVYKQGAVSTANIWAVSDWGKGMSVAWKKKEFFAQCEKTMKFKFPFPAPVPGRCELIKKSPIYKNPAYKGMLDQQIAKCQSDAAKQVPSPTAWAYVCRGPADKFATEYAAAKQAVEDSVKKLEALGCKKEQKTVSAEPKLACSTYEGFDACKNAYGGKLPCSLVKNKADTALAEQILKQLGTKRCKIEDEIKTVPCLKKDVTMGVTMGSCQQPEKNIVCSRPWKIDQCKTLLDKLASAPGTAVWCKGDPTGLALFAVQSKQAADIVFKLNGGVGSKAAPGTTQGQAGTWKPGTSSNCKTIWDPLSITCGKLDVLATYQVSLPQCTPDPNKDGADAPCLLEMLKASLPPDAQKIKGVFQGPLKGSSPEVLAPPPVLVSPPAGLPPPPMQNAPAGPAQPMAAPPALAPPPALVPPPTLVPAQAPAQIAPMVGPQVPGCSPLAGQAGQYACATREAYAGCERLRASGAAGIRQCQSTGGRMRP